MNSDFESIQGEWMMIESRIGSNIRNTGFEKNCFRFHGHRFIHLKSKSSNRFELRDDRMPKEIDFVHVSTRSVSMAIYELNGDDLKVMYKGNNSVLPSSLNDDNCEVWMFRRKKS